MNVLRIQIIDDFDMMFADLFDAIVDVTLVTTGFTGNVSTSQRRYVHMCVCMYVCMYVCAYVCMYVCMYVRKYYVCMCYVRKYVCIYESMHV